jgi:hypothetical protein
VIDSLFSDKLQASDTSSVANLKSTTSDGIDQWAVPQQSL